MAAPIIDADAEQAAAEDAIRNSREYQEPVIDATNAEVR